MNVLPRIVLMFAALVMGTQAVAQVTLYENDGFQGLSVTTDGQIMNLERFGLSNRASSAMVAGNRLDRWEVCEDRRFRGRCVVLRPGRYVSLAAMGLNDRISSVRAVARNVRVGEDRYAPLPQPPSNNQIVFFENEDFGGRTFTADTAIPDLRVNGFNDRASSAIVSGERWEVCQDMRFGGPCAILRPGRYPSLTAMGLNDRVSSVRAAGGPRAEAPPEVPTPPAGQVVFYEHEAFRGRSFTVDTAIVDLGRSGFDDQASSAVVSAGRWEVCQDPRFGAPCAVLRPGQYPSLAAMGLNDRISSVREVGGPRADAQPEVPTLPAGQVVFYENEGFRGRSFTADTAMVDLSRSGFNDQASSAVVTAGRWEVCQDPRFGAPCAVLRPGQYPSLAAMGLNDRISSVRAMDAAAQVEEPRYAPMPAVSRDYGRRNDERLYEANITSVRAVVEDSGQRCWVEKEQAVQEGRGGANVPGALLGAVIGGILGHQVGGGTGRDVATGVGVIAGAAIGGNAGRSGGQQVATTQDVQRCRTVPGQARPAYWDVTYTFRGQEFRVQMTTPPGATVTVNEHGEPRA